MGFDKDTDKLLKFIILFVFENRETRKDQFFWHLECAKVYTQEFSKK